MDTLDYLIAEANAIYDAMADRFEPEDQDVEEER